MAGWDDILHEIQQGASPFDTVRRKYLRKLSKLTNRNTITYYSAWLDKQNVEGIDIIDNDITGFMNAIKDVDCSKGLDLILHTPGGSPVAAEAIVKYLRSKFGKNIRAIVPHLAMSAGTMIACSASQIVMGKHSSLGPIDPQFNGIPAYNIKMEYENALLDLQAHPENVNYWGILLGKYPAAFLKTALDAIELSGVLLKEWIGTCMYDSSNPDDSVWIDKIVSTLNEHEDSKAHARHFDAEFCKSIGIRVVQLEDDPALQNAVLSVHHSYVHTLRSTNAIKIIENNAGKAYINMGG